MSSIRKLSEVRVKPRLTNGYHRHGGALGTCAYAQEPVCAVITAQADVGHWIISGLELLEEQRIDPASSIAAAAC